MKIAVLGSNGMLGHAVALYFKRQGWTVVYVTHEKYDVIKTSITTLEGILSGHNVDAVVNCIGVTKPTIDDYDYREVMVINGLFPILLAKYCTKQKIKCFHITTDCVFSGKVGNYTENDFPEMFPEIDLYGISKGMGDYASVDCMVLRTSIIGEEKIHKRHLLSWAIENKGKTVQGYTNHFWNGVTTTYLAERIHEILDPDKYGIYRKGIYHIHSPNAVSKKELLELIDATYDLDLTIEPFEHEIKCDRTLRTRADHADVRFRRDFEQYDKPLDLQLKEMKEFFDHAAN